MTCMLLLSVLSLSYVDIVCLVSAGILNDEGVSSLLPYCHLFSWIISVG